jgi:hypothetical protein
MPAMFGRRWAVLSVVLLVDAAPTPHCGSDPVRPQPVLEIRASNCACAPGVIEALVDGSVMGELTCGPAGALMVSVSEGDHVVSARADGVSWPQQTCRAGDGKTTVELGCPLG